MKTWDDFLPKILPYAPGCPDITALERLKDAAQEFLERSRVWRVWLTITTTAALDLYTPTLPSGAQLVELHSATLNGSGIEVGVNPDDTQTGLPNLVYTEDLVQIGLYPIPSTSGQIARVRASLTTSDAALGVEDFLFERYAESIACGALYRICITPDKSYTNVGLASDKMNAFERDIAEYAAAKSRGNTSKPHRVRSHLF